MIFVASHCFASTTVSASIVYRPGSGSMISPLRSVPLAAIYQYVHMRPLCMRPSKLLILMDHQMNHLTNNLILGPDPLRSVSDYYCNMCRRLIVADDDSVLPYYHCCRLYHCHQCPHHSRHRHRHRSPRYHR